MIVYYTMVYLKTDVRSIDKTSTCLSSIPHVLPSTHSPSRNNVFMKYENDELNAQKKNESAPNANQWNESEEKAQNNEYFAKKKYTENQR